MAIFHCSVKIISRSSGRSSVGASAYRAGEKIKNQNDGETHDYSKRKDVAHTEIILPDTAPEWMKKRSALWNAVEKSEKRKDARTAREIEIALPTEIDREQQIELVKKYAQENFVSSGMIADFAIHDKGDDNPHAHIMLTTREVTPEGFAGKNRDWNDKKLLGVWRENLATLTNEALEKAGFLERVDHRTLEAQGIERPPQVHQGAVITAMERRGVVTEIGERNRDLREIAELDKKIAELQRDPHEEEKITESGAPCPESVEVNEAHEAGETHPEKIPESPTKTPDKVGTSVLGEYPTAAEAKARIRALRDAISAPILEQLRADRQAERDRLEEKNKKTEEQLRAAEASEKPKKPLFDLGGKYEKALQQRENAIKDAKTESAAAAATIADFDKETEKRAVELRTGAEHEALKLDPPAAWVATRIERWTEEVKQMGFPGRDKIYEASGGMACKGEILFANAEFVAQATGNKSVILHDIRDFETPPRVGQTVEIKHGRNGVTVRGSVASHRVLGR